MPNLPTDPRAMSDDELVTWITDLIARRTEESPTLDYKAEFGDLSQTKVKRELAKDVSSFANEGGGVVLYGVPEVRDGNVLVPEALPACGIPLYPQLRERIESVLLDAIAPVLPEIHIRVVRIAGMAGEGLIFVHHPASWNSPHMVTAYDDGRYYRRGNFQAVKMHEHDVAAAYARRRARIARAETFLASAAVHSALGDGSVLRVAVCPAALPSRWTGGWDFRNALEAEMRPTGRAGGWVPFVDGYRFTAYGKGGVNGREFEYRLFATGPLLFIVDLTTTLFFKNGRLQIPYVRGMFENNVLAPASKMFSAIDVRGPLVIEVRLFNSAGMQAGDAATPNTWCFPNEDLIRPLDGEIAFTEESSVSELQFDCAKVADRVADRFAAAFGMERVPGR
jgi:hypothetical protein